MTKRALKIGLIGTGSISGHFIKSINDLPMAELVALCSSTPERAAKAGQTHDLPAYADLHAMIAERQPDVLCVCTQSGHHLEPTLTAAQAGIHVICEKPLEVTLDRADQMIRTCHEQNVQLACIFQNRYSPDYKKLHTAVREGKLGKLLMGNAYIKWYRSDEYYAGSSWRGTLKGDGGAALINQGIHTIDLLSDIMGSVDTVTADISTMTHDIEGEDVAMAMLRFSNGAMGTIQASTSFWPGYPERLEVFGEKGSVILEGGSIAHWNIQGEEATPVVENQAQPSGSSDPMAISYHLHRTQIGEILADIRDGRTPTIHGREGRKSLAIIDAIYRSAREGKRVTML